MNQLQPTEFELQLVYKCPKCNQPSWLSVDEVQTPNFKIVCCGKAAEIKQIESIKLKISFVKEHIFKNSINTNNNNKHVINSAFQVLRAYGYTTEEVNRFAKTEKFTTAEVLVKKFLGRKPV